MSSDTSTFSDDDLNRFCRTALEAEARAIAAFASEPSEFAAAVRLICAAKGPLIVAGIGKSGHVGTKIASTFRSIGRSAIFLHAAEASHGDLGLVAPDSVVLILSNSGETPELSDLIHYARVHAIPVIAVTRSAESTLARAAAVTIAYGAVEEVDPNGLAPTTSTTLTLAIGDALAVAVTHCLGTAPEDFRRYHPGGKLGVTLLTVADLMHRDTGLPVVGPATPMSETVVVMSEKALGVAVVTENDLVRGIITDGDMRRHAGHLWESSAGDIATANPVSVREEMRAAKALELMTEKKITACLVTDENGRLRGLLHIHDCLRAGLV
jgi:arabinose-5-phosphate isomerase